MKRFALIAAAVLALATGCASEPPPVSQQVMDYYEKNRTLAPKTEAPVVKVKAANIVPGTKAVIFGDSWTAGLFMQPNTQGYAYRAADVLGWDAEVIGGSGTGYLNPGKDGLGTYPERMAKLPVSDAKLLVIQGSVNDFGKNLLELGPAFDKTIATARVKFPQAQIVILGPSTSVMPTQSALGGADNILGERAANAGLPYISPYLGRWIEPANFPAVISKANSHPTAEGHAYLAGKFVAALKALAA